MCHDPAYVDQLQLDHRSFTLRAQNGDERAARAADETALALQALGVPLKFRPSAPLAVPQAEEAEETEEVHRVRSRMFMGDVL